MSRAEWPGTFAVDAQMRMYIDFDAVAGWGAAECAQVLLHEGGPPVRRPLRKGGDLGIGPQDQQLWNAASDASLNDDLAQVGCDYIAETGIMPTQFGEPDFATAQHYYGALRKLQQQQPGDDTGQAADTESGEGAGHRARCGTRRPVRWLWLWRAGLPLGT